MFESVLVPLDGSEVAARALAPAVAIAKAVDSPLRVVGYVTPLTGQEVGDAIAQQVDELDLDDLSVHIGRPDVSVAAELYQEAVATPGTLVVMTSYGAGRTGAALGSVADGFLARGFGPVLLVGPNCEVDRFVPGGRMLVPLDGSDTADKILPIVASWAMVLGMRPEIVSVVEPSPPPPVAPGQVSDLPLESNLVHAAAQKLGRDIGRDVDYEVLHGKKPAKSIVTHAADTGAAMIALSTHGRTGLARLVAGSVAMKVLHEAPCPVMMYRPPHLR